MQPPPRAASPTRSDTFRLRARRVLVLGLPADAAVDDLAPAVAGASRLRVVAVALQVALTALGTPAGGHARGRGAVGIAGRVRGGDAAALDARAPPLEEPRASWWATISKLPSGGSSMSGSGTPDCGGWPSSSARRAAMPASRARARRPRGHRPVSAPGAAAVTVAIVDYGSGNLHSAPRRSSAPRASQGIDQPIVVTRDPDAVRARRSRRAARASAPLRIAAAGSMPSPGMVEALNESGVAQRPAVPRHLRRHAADGRARPRIRGGGGLGWIPGEVDRITPADRSLKIPHMGWNTLAAAQATSAARRHSARGRRAARLFRALLSPEGRAIAPISWPRRIMAVPSPPSWRAIPMPAPSSTREEPAAGAWR